MTTYNNTTRYGSYIPRNIVKDFYIATIKLVPAEERAALKAHIDSYINQEADYIRKPRHIIAADVIAAQAAQILGTHETKIPEESWDHGMFLTGGHTFYYYEAARQFISKYYPEYAANLKDRAN